MPQFTRYFSILRVRPFETNTEGGRSKERLRRAALTTVSSGLSRTFGIFTSLITVPLTYRYLGAERYGIWMVLLSIIAAMSFADLGIGNGLMNAISEAYGKDDRILAREYVSSALALMLTIASFFAIIGVAAYPFLPWLRLLNVTSQTAASEGAHAFLILYGSFILNIPLGVIVRAQAGLQKGYYAQIVNAAGSILSLGIILCVIWMHGGLIWLVSGIVFASMLSTCVNGLILFRQCPWLVPSRRAFSASSALKIFKLGLLFFILQCAFTLGFTSDNIVIDQILGAVAVAVYSIPQKLFSFVAQVVSMAINPLWPAYGEAIARGDIDWVRRVFFASLCLVIAVTIPICTLLVFTAPWILKIALGKSFHASLSLLIILGVWGVVNAASSVTSIFLNGAGVLKEQSTLAVIASISNLALSVFFTRRFGVMGVCLGSIATQLGIVLPIYAVLIPKQFKKMQLANQNYLTLQPSGALPL